MQAHYTAARQGQSVSLDVLSVYCAPPDVSQPTCVLASEPPLLCSLEQLGMKTDQVVLHQECGVEWTNEFQ